MDIGLFLGLSKFAAASHVRIEFFKSDSRARRRLRQLWDNGFIDRFQVGSSTESLLTLSNEGLALVKSMFPEQAGRVTRATRVSLSSVDHHLLLVSTRLFAKAWCEAQGWSLATWESGCNQLARELNMPRLKLRPDAVLELERPDGDDCWLVAAVEADCGTEGGTEEDESVLANKWKRYDQVGPDVGGLDWLWVVVRGGKDRLAGIERSIARAGLESWTWVIAEDRLLTRPVDVDAARRPGADDPKGSYTASGESQEVVEIAAEHSRKLTLGELRNVRRQVRGAAEPLQGGSHA